jgi:hypothetical protein
VVGILRRAGQNEPNPMRSWSTDAGDARNDPVIAAELADWLRSHGIKDSRSLGARRRRSVSAGRPSGKKYKKCCGGVNA